LLIENQIEGEMAMLYTVIMLRSLNKIFFLCVLILPLHTMDKSTHPLDPLLDPPTALTGKQISNEPQGIIGHVIKLSGSYFPPVRPNRAKLEPVATKVWIFSGRIMAPLEYAPPPLDRSLPRPSHRWSLDEARKHPNLVGWTMSDSAGQFKVGLKPGVYTLFAQYRNSLYLSCFHSDNSYYSIQVEANKIQAIELVNRENTSF
jgi:hypothetical protein